MATEAQTKLINELLYRMKAELRTIIRNEETNTHRDAATRRTVAAQLQLDILGGIALPMLNDRQASSVIDRLRKGRFALIEAFLDNAALAKSYGVSDLLAERSDEIEKALVEVR